MPYVLRSYETGTQLSATNTAPQGTGTHERFAQAGWVPAAAGLHLTVGSVYRLDDPNGGTKRKIKLVSIGAGQNAITYDREGVA